MNPSPSPRVHPVRLFLAIVALATAVILAFQWQRLRPAPVERTPPAVPSGPRAPDEPADPGLAAPGEPARGGAPAATASVPAPADPAVEVEARWHAAGSVHARGGPPLGAATVSLALRTVDGDETPLGEARSAADGAWRLALPALDARSPLELAGVFVVARADAAGFQPLTTQRRIEDSFDSARVAIDLYLVPGSALRGRAVDDEGRPVARATAALFVRGPSGGSAELIPAGEVRADAGGRFALGFVSAAGYHLLVRAEGVGVHRARLDLAADQDRDLGDLALRGGDPLRGVALHADGQPAQHLELWALEGNMAFRPNGLAEAVGRIALAELGDGLSIGRTWTDAQGRFSIGGLRPDHYALVSPDPGIVIEPRQGRWEPGQQNVTLTVHSPRIVVTVVDGEGRPVPGAVVECTEVSLEDEGRALAGETRRAVTRGAEGVATFAADPETPVAIRARARGVSSAERLVFLGQGVEHREEQLVLSAPRGTGRIRLVYGGDPVPQPPRLCAVLTSPVSGLRDEERGTLEADASGVLHDVPAGEHGLIVEALGGHWFPWRSSVPVRVEPGAETPVTVAPRLGGRLTVRCTLVGRPPSGLEELAPEGGARRGRFGVHFTLTPLGGGRTQALALRVGDAEHPALLPGESGLTTALLEPGDYTLRAEGPAWIGSEATVRVVPGSEIPAVIDVRAR